MTRLAAMYTPDEALPLAGVPDDDPSFIIAKIADALAEGAADGAHYIELRFGAAGLAFMRPDFMALFREAERQVQAQYPHVHAEALAFLPVATDPARRTRTEQHLERCLQLARQGLAGIDLIVAPYDTEADPALWQHAYRWAEQATDAGLGITVHAGEFSPANLGAALNVPGLQRLGHAVHATADPHILERLAQEAITVECCLSCNVILGAVSSYETHPIRDLVTAGVRVTLNTDDPVRIWTTIGREYALAACLGFSVPDLLTFTRNAIQAAFTTTARRDYLLEAVRRWEAELAPS